MKMLLIIIDESKKEELEVFLEHCGIHGYTEVPGALGTGTSGPRLGSSAFPRTSAMVYTLVSEEALETLRQGIDRFCSTCGEELRMVAWDAEILR